MSALQLVCESKAPSIGSSSINSYEEDKCFVYIVDSPYNSYLKIGCARCAPSLVKIKLLKRYQTFYPFPTILVFEMKIDDKLSAERKVFDILAEHRICIGAKSSGEHFTCSLSIAELACLTVQQSYFDEKLQQSYFDEKLQRRCQSIIREKTTEIELSGLSQDAFPQPDISSPIADESHKSGISSSLPLPSISYYPKLDELSFGALIPEDRSKLFDILKYLHPILEKLLVNKISNFINEELRDQELVVDVEILAKDSADEKSRCTMDRCRNNIKRKMKFYIDRVPHYVMKNAIKYCTTEVIKYLLFKRKDLTQSDVQEVISIMFTSTNLLIELTKEYAIMIFNMYMYKARYREV